MAEHCLRETTSEARYAVKRLLPEIANDKNRLYAGLADLVIETRILYHLEHPNIVKIRGIATFSPFSKDFFIVMDRLYDTLLVRLQQWAIRKKKAQSLFSRLICGRAKKISHALLGEQLKSAFDLSGALEYLHTECRVCHRDIKVSQ
jgi:serine/threonine protein kinase